MFPNARPLAPALLVLAAAACGDRAGTDLASLRTALTPDSGRAYGSDIAADGRLAFMTPVEGKAAIWVAGPEGAEARRITYGVWDANPIWSPDGTWIAFYRDSSANVWAVPAAGGDAVPLTATPESEEPIGWLHDGSGVVFQRAGRGSYSTWSVPLADAQASRLLDVEGPHVAMPSPDGSRVVYSRSAAGQTTLWIWDRASGAHRQLTTEGFEWLEPDFAAHVWSPDGSAVVFGSGRTGRPDLWIADVVSGSLRQLTRHIAADLDPRWSPDGRWVAFRSDRGGQWDVWIIPAAGGQVVRVTDDPEAEASLRWSADGHSLTFTRAAGTSHLWVVPADGGAPRQVTSGRGRDGNPQVSPDGTQVLFESDRSGNSDLWVVPLAGGEPRRLTDSPMHDGTGRWSPDGRTIVFVSSRGGGRSNLYTMPAAGGTATALTDWAGGAHLPAWSPDGSHIAFHSGRDAMREDLWVIPAAGGEARRVTTLDGGLIGPAVWSPDGRHLFFTGTADAPGPEAVYRVALAGGAPIRLASGDLSQVALSPDGRQLLYTVFDAGYGYLHSVAAAGGEPRRLTVADTAYDQLAEWSPDGSRIAFMPFDYSTSLEYVAVLSAEGGAVRTVVRDVIRSLGNPVWTPDGSAIVYQGVDITSQVVRVRVSGLLERAIAEQDASGEAAVGG
jgi:Tol biopolymer transport system component